MVEKADTGRGAMRGDLWGLRWKLGNGRGLRPGG